MACLLLILFAPAEDLIIVREGTLPILLSAPHGGRTPIPNATVRRGLGVEKFTTVLDGNTDRLVELIAADLEKTLGGKPYVVIAKFERKYADANRPAEDAYESDAAKPVYERYHKALKDARAAIAKDWAAGLLLDIHGQGGEVNTVFRGTADGKSVEHLMKRHGEAALIGPKSVFGSLAKQDVVVHPAIGSKDRESRAYNGGYIVQTYGSADGGNIDAIQLVFGTNLRQKTALEETARKTAAAIANYSNEYLPKTKK